MAPKMPAWMPASMLVMQLISLAWSLFVLYVVTRLERIGCKCALDWKLDFIRNFTMFIVFWISLCILAGLVSPAALLHPAFQAVGFVVSILSLVVLVIALTYISQLRAVHCTCAESTARNVWEIVLWLRVAMIVTAFVMTIIMVAMGHSAIKHGRKSSSSRK